MQKSITAFNCFFSLYVPSFFPIIVDHLPSSVALSTASLHAARHKLGGGDVILLHEFGLPTSSIDFNRQYLLNTVLHAVSTTSSFPATPVVGQIAFVAADLSPYICTINA